MEISGFNEKEFSVQNKEALQSETWQEARKAMKREIRHFVDGLSKDDPYGYPWEQVVDAYLKDGYKEGGRQYELTVLGATYKVLKRGEVTAFYDVDGNTLFDVQNKRLEKEYGHVMQDGKMIAGLGEENNNAAESGEKSADLEKEKADKETGKTKEEKPGEKKGNDELAEDVVPPDPVAIKQMAKGKLEKEMKDDKDKTFAEPVIGYLLKRCEEDTGLAQDVMQEHKTWSKCFDYIFEQARKQAKGNKAAVRDDVVYEWAEDYYHKDDKAEEEKKAKEATERKKKQEERMKKAKSKPNKPETPKPKEEPKTKKNSKEMDGQLDMFSMMGM